MNSYPLRSFAVSDEIAGALAAAGEITILALGDCDTGKTSLVEALAGRLAAAGPVAVVDLDTGQSHVGPPTTLAWGMLDGGFTSWDAIRAVDMYFVGATSPSWNMTGAVAGAGLIYQRARERCQRIIVDCTGYVSPGGGAALQTSCIELIRPDVILAIQRTDELDPILVPLGGLERPVIHHLPVCDAVAEKSVEARRDYRAARFHEYFAGAPTLAIPLNGIGVRNGELSLERRLVSLRGADGWDRALGVIESGRLADELKVITPLEPAVQVCEIVFGSNRLDAEFRQFSEDESCGGTDNGTSQ